MALLEYNDGLILRSLIDDLVPSHVAHNYPGLIAAAKSYADFLEHSNGAGHILNTIDLQRDIDIAETQFLQELQKEIGAPIPRQFAADPRKFYKRITEFYRSRGTPDSIEAFFRILYDDEVEIYFPKDDMFIPSDGKWYSQSADVIANPASYTPLFTYTIASASTAVGGNDDAGRKLSYDNPVVFVNGVHATNFAPLVVINTATNTLDYSFEFDTQLEVDDVVTVYRDGSFSTNDGFMNDLKKVQDSFYYQKFSYVLRTGTNADVWKNAFNRLVHPAGFIFFGEILLFLDSLGQTIPFIQPGFQTGGLPFPITIPSVDAAPQFIKTSNGIIASYILKEYSPLQNSNLFGPAQHWDYLKFDITDTLGEIGNYTFEDVINNNIKNNINAEISLSS
jgi:hypothetical protein